MLGLLARFYLSGKQTPRTVKRWQRKMWPRFSAENQDWFDSRWADVRTLANAGWFTFVSIAPIIAPVTLPDDFLALGKRTWDSAGPTNQEVSHAMTDNIIDFEMEKERRLARDQLFEVMADLPLRDIALISATLHALLEVLESFYGLSRLKTKQRIKA
jgi:hypothetical protein